MNPSPLAPHEEPSSLGSLRKYPVAIGCFIVCILLGCIAYYRDDAASDKQALLTETTAKADRIASNLRNATQLKEQSAEVDASLVQINRRIIHPAELDTNLQIFLRLEAETGTRVIQLQQNVLSQQDKEKKKGLVAVPYTIAVQGEFYQILDFLRRVEHGHGFCRILGATINAPLVVPGDPSHAAGREVAPVLTLALSLELLGQIQGS